MDIDKIDLSKLTRDQLEKLQIRVAAELKNYDEKRKREALSEIEKLAQDRGYSLAEIIEGRSLSRKVHPPKFRDPKDAKKTWSGRGRKPDWFREAIEDGYTEEDMLIDQSET